MSALGLWVIFLGLSFQILLYVLQRYVYICHIISVFCVSSPFEFWHQLFDLSMTSDFCS